MLSQTAECLLYPVNYCTMNVKVSRWPAEWQIIINTKVII